MSIRSFDHVAIPIQNTDAMLSFYRALGFGVQERGQSYSVFFGDNKINFHSPDKWHSPEFTLRGPTAVPGCGDFCFVWDGSVESLKTTLDQAGAKIIEGPIQRHGRPKQRPRQWHKLLLPRSRLQPFRVYDL